MTKKWYGVIAGVLLAAGGVGGFGCCTVEANFVRASRAVHDTIVTDFLEYTEADPNLDESQKQIRRDTVRLWGEQIEAAEKRLEGAKTP